jgi:diadenosine tetraphosphate (Ap4A) HIT family hydrolase
MSQATCELCGDSGGEVLHRHEKFRVVLVDDANYPGFCRVIWNEHVKEMTDLSDEDRRLLMAAVYLVETVLRSTMRPEKINIASLGNMTPHLHWHVIPRYLDDAHFPGPIWAQPQRTPTADALASRAALLPSVRTGMAREFEIW